jgi:hypothetical protein
MGIKFKKVSQNDRACFYALVEDVSATEYKGLVNWLTVHCPDTYELSRMHLIIARENELFFELTFPII